MRNSLSQEVYFNLHYLFNTLPKGIIKWLLLLSNALIISDAIFLLIKEKDSYQGEFIEGRHPVFNLFVLMLYLDIESLLMILTGVLGIIGTRKRNEVLLAVYAVVMTITALLSYPDMDATITELALSFLAIVYLMLIRDNQSRNKYTEIITTIA